MSERIGFAVDGGDSTQGTTPAPDGMAQPSAIDPPPTAWAVVTFNAKDDGSIDHYKHSTVACCTTLERAREIVERNEVDIHETDEDYAVIERAVLDSPYGLAGDFPRPRYWYRWQGKPDDGQYVPCDEPSEVESIVCWAGF